MDSTEQQQAVAEKVILLLTRQRDLYLRLKDLAYRQRELVDSSDPELLLKVLANRQRIIDQLSLTDRQLRPIRENWQKVSESFSDIQRNNVSLLIDQVKNTIEDILNRDKKDTETLTNKKNEIAVELKKARTGRQMGKVYQAAGKVSESKYCDIGG